MGRGWRPWAWLTLAIGIGIYGFVFFRDGEWVYSIVDDKLYLTSPNWDSVSGASAEVLFVWKCGRPTLTPPSPVCSATC